MIFSALPFAGAAEIQNTGVNQSISVNTSETSAITNQSIKNHGIKIGAEGKHVVELQKWLKNQGFYTGDLDGSFGPYTKEAVKIFQTDANIVVDGWVANQTINSMEDLTGGCIFTTSDYTSSSDSKSTETKSNNVNSAKNDTTSKISENTKTSTSSKKVSKNNETKSVSKKTSTSSTSKKSVSKTKSATSSSSLSQILASGAKYGYSHSASTAAGMMSCGSGDCWAMSDYLYSKLRAAGIKSRIVQYSTAYSARHRSVQLYQNGAWVDVPYSSYGYSTMFKATSCKPGLTVIAS
jgi:peptidoglycan hydrolase-like protein with peptidoglycan-binding domain